MVAQEVPAPFGSRIPVVGGRRVSASMLGYRLIPSRPIPHSLTLTSLGAVMPVDSADGTTWVQLGHDQAETLVPVLVPARADSSSNVKIA
jgi:hypothetical protein